MIETRALETLRTIAETELTDTCTIQRWSGTGIELGGPSAQVGPAGGHTGSYADYLTDVPCRVLATGGGSEGLTADRLQHINAVRVLVAHDTDVTTDDLLVIDDVKYEVAGIDVRTEQVLKQVTATRTSR